jgi:hypothetical protein
VAICPLDHGIMGFGEKGLGTIDPDYVPATPEARVSLFNNFWTTNFRYWIGGTVTSRVRVWATASLNAASLTVPALDARQPVLVGVADGPPGRLPAEQSGLTFSRPGIQLVAFGGAADAGTTVLRVWEMAGLTADLTISLPGTFTTATPVNLRGEPIAGAAGAPVPIVGGKLTFPLGACAPASFTLK